MNKIGILLLGALSLLANPPCFSQSKTFYLSPQGKDKADGSLNKPWKTASHAFQQINQITNGDITLIVQDGDYFLSDSLALNGKNHNGKITIMAANKGKANFIGYRTITKFSKVKSKTERNCFAPNVQGHILRAKLKKAGIIDYLQAATEHNRFELYLNGKRQQLSRWPNDSSVKTGAVLGKTIDTKNKSIVEGFFKYTNPYIDKFAADDDLYLHGYFCYKWFDNIERVAEIDKINRTITIAKPYHHYGYKEGQDFYVLNNMSEVDEPGEYYVDRKNGYLYWYPPATFNPQKDHVIVPVFKDANMLTIEDGSHITIDGINFIGGSNGAISITEGDHAKIENCRISQFGACAITVNGGKDHTVYNCNLEELGQEGIVANGGDRKTLENSGFLFSNNTIKDFSLYRDTYRQGLVFYGCGVTISHNLFANSPSSALGLGGNNITVEYNVFKDAVKKSNDQGVIDIYFNPSFRGIVIRNNYFKDIVGTDKLDMVAAVRLDDMISGAAIYNNVFDNCGSSHFGAVQIHGGKDNHVFNNLFYHCLGCFSQSAWGKDKWLKTLDTANMKKLIYEDVDINSALYKKNYPELEISIRENADQNFFNDNLFVDTPNQYRRISSNCIIKNNQDVSSQQSIQEFCNPTTLKTYGLTGINLKLCGPMITTPLP